MIFKLPSVYTRSFSALSSFLFAMIERLLTWECSEWISKGYADCRCDVLGGETKEVVGGERERKREERIGKRERKRGKRMRKRGE